MEPEASASLKRPCEEVDNCKETNKMQKTDAGSDGDASVQTTSSTNEQGLSKSQLKKLKKKEYWEKAKPRRRAKDKEKLRQKKLAAKLNNVNLGPSRKALKNSKMETSNCKVSVVIDMSFDELMDARSLGKCNKQLLHCYSLNRRAPNPMQLYFTSLSGKSLEEMVKHDGYRNWDVNIKSEHFSKVFPTERLVYLTSESDNVVEKLEDDKVYVIGGLVDHNAHKGHCFDVAKQLGISHAQLPIGQFLEMKTRKVLTIDHVFSILLNVSSGQSWKEAFLQVLPERKGAREKSDSMTSAQDSESLDTRPEESSSEQPSESS